MTEGKSTILICDDHEDIRTNIKKALGSKYVYHEAGTDQELRSALVEVDIDVVILDLRIPGSQNQFLNYAGLESLRFIKNDYPFTPVIVFSAREDDGYREDAFRLGAFAYVPKSNSWNKLAEKVHEAIFERARLLQERKKEKSNSKQMVAEVSLNDLKNKMDSAYNEEEFQALCFDLEITYEDLEGKTRIRKIQSLIEHCQRRQMLPQLVNACKSTRPYVDWPEL